LRPLAGLFRLQESQELVIVRRQKETSLAPLYIHVYVPDNMQ